MAALPNKAGVGIRGKRGMERHHRPGGGVDRVRGTAPRQPGSRGSPDDPLRAGSKFSRDRSAAAALYGVSRCLKRWFSAFADPRPDGPRYMDADEVPRTW